MLIRVLFLVLAASCATHPLPSDHPPAESLAECLARQGAHLYGAAWCEPCHAQLRLFGDDASKVPYTDCFLADGLTEIAECRALGIEHYPTWTFPGGYKIVGVRSLAWLANVTDCPLR